LHRVTTRISLTLAVIAICSAVFTGSSIAATFSQGDRVRVEATGAVGTVAVVADAGHVVVAFDGDGARVASYRSASLSDVTVAPPPPAPEPYPTRTASTLGSFDQRSAVNGDLTEAEGTFTARYDGGSNGYARGVFEYESPPIREGQEWWAGARFFLPAGFSSTAGYVSLMRRDNWPLYDALANTCGVALWGGDNRLHVECNTYDGSWNTQNLVGGVAAPEGRWFTLELHQRLDSTAGSITELFLNGTKVGSSTGINNLLSRVADRVRFGIVAVGPQSQGYSLQFRDPYVSSTRQPLQ